MKEFSKTDTVTYNLMSFTAFKSLFIFSLFLEAPRSYKEIQEYFLNHKYLKEDVSIDTLRVYLTSLKRCGCTIEKQKKKDGGKFKMTSHPFELKITDEQIKSLVKLYKIVLKTSDAEDILAYEKFLYKLSKYTRNIDLKQAIDKISVFKKFDRNLIEDLVKYAKNQTKITILYNSPRSQQEEIEVVTNNIDISDGKLYLSGVGLKYNKETSYLIDRIIKITDVDLEHRHKVQLKPVTVGYELSVKVPNTKLGKDDKIVEIKDDSIIVETQTTNLFAMKRKIFEYGSNCTVLYPQEFREEIIKTLKEMKAGYADD